MIEMKELVLNLKIWIIGIPVRIVVGKKACESIVEYKERSNSEVKEMTYDELIKLF